MKNRNILLLSISILVLTSSVLNELKAQPGWHIIAPTPTNYSLYSVSFISETTGWFAGNSDQILKTTDGGTTWTKQNANTGKNLWGVHFADAQHGWVADMNGGVSATADGGSTWAKQSESGYTWFWAMQFPDATHGFVLVEQDSLFYTTNGGTKWNRIKIDATQYHYGMKFINANEGWITGSGGQILHSVNGGLTWTPQNSGTDVDLYTVDFIDNMNGWAAGYSTYDDIVLHTTDGGVTWQKLVQNFNDKFTKIDFIDNQSGNVICNSGIVYHTTNGGSTWTPAYTSPHEAIWDVKVLAGGTGFVCGAYGTMLKTIDSGTAWTPIYNTATHGFKVLDISFPDQKNGWVLDDGALLKHTADSGKTWNDQTPFTSAFKTAAIHFSDSKRGWLVGKWPDGGYGQILRTTDGGATFNFQLNLGKYPFVSVSFSDSLHGIAGSVNQMIYYTSNGGVLWDSVTVPTSASYVQAKNVQMVSNTTAYAILSYINATALAKTTDGGKSWSVNKTDNTQFTAAYTALSFVDEQNGYIAGFNFNGTPNKIYLLKTSDGGANWTQVDFPSNLPENIGGSTINAICFSDKQHGWVAGGGFSSYILYTADGGSTWSTQESGTNVAWYTMKFLDSQTGYAAGGEGNIIKTSTGGSLGINDYPKATFSDLQVFPNPADQLITIINPMPGKSMMQLALYDILGKVVYSTGTSGANFQVTTAALPNGLYLLQLSSKETIARQKVLIKH